MGGGARGAVELIGRAASQCLARVWRLEWTAGGLAINLVSMALMNLAPLLNRFAVLNLEPLLAALLNTALVLGFALSYSAVRRRRVGFRVTPLVLAIGVTDAAGVILLYQAVYWLSPVTVGFLARFYNVFALVLALLFLREVITRWQWLAIVGALLGSFLFVDGIADRPALLGVAAALGYTLLFALANLLGKLAVGSKEAMEVLTANKAVSLVVLLVAVLARGLVIGPPSVSEVSVRGVGFVVLASLLCNFVGLLLFYEGLKRWDFTKVNVLRSLGPVVVALYAWPFFPVPVTGWKVAGAALLLASAGWLAITDSRRRPGPLVPAPASGGQPA